MLACRVGYSAHFGLRVFALSRFRSKKSFPLSRSPRSGPPSADPAAAEDEEDEAREGGDFADLARVFPEAVEPFEPAPLHPERRARDAAREDVEGAAHAHRHRHSQRLLAAPEPLLLARDPEGNEQEVRPHLPDPRFERRPLLLGEEAVGRTG